MALIQLDAVNQGAQLTELKWICRVNFTIANLTAAELLASDLILGFQGKGIQQFRMALNTNWETVEADTVAVLSFESHISGDSVATTRDKITRNMDKLALLTAV